MNLKGEKILLRAIEKKDLIYLKQMINDPYIENATGGWGKPISDFVQEKWFENILNEKNKIRYAIEVDQKFAGTIILEDIDWKNRKASISIKLLLDQTHKGIGTEAIELIKKYAFEELNLNRLVAYILDYNISSLRLFEKCGFYKEGILKENVFKNNNYVDTVIYRILKEEY